MKKNTIFLVLLICVCAVVFTAAHASASEFESMKIVIGTSSPTGIYNQYWQYVEKFKELVAEKTGGKVEIEPHYNAELGNERDLNEGVHMGTVDMCFTSTGPLGNFVPETMVFGFPFIFRDFDHVEKVLTGDVGKKLKDLVEQQLNVKLLCWAGEGFHYLSNHKQPIKTPEDVKGLKLRTQENKVQMETILALGGDPTPIPSSELYTALQQGTIDGMTGVIPYMVTGKFFEVDKHLTLTAHLFMPAFPMLNKDLFDKMSPQLQTVIIESAEEARVYQMKWLRDSVELVRPQILDYGVEIVETDQIDIEAFRNVTQPVYDMYPELKGLIDEIRNVK